MLDEVIARQFIYDIANLGVSKIGFAGGEAVLRLELLCELICQCKSLSLTPIVVTSGYWGKSERQTERIVSGLRAAGLDDIQLSLDNDHLEFMEIGHLASALAACKSAGFRNIKVIGTSRGNDNNFSTLVFYLEQVLKVSTEGMDLVDRNRVSHGSFESEQETYTLDYLENNVPRPSCMTEMMIDVNGDVYPCCQNFIGCIGNLHNHNISDIFAMAGDREEFRIFEELGPVQYAKRLDSQAGTNFGAKGYGSWCEVCSRTFGDPMFKDLLCTPLSLHQVLATISKGRNLTSSLPVIQEGCQSCGANATS
jgi:MoaA/NifB/PqqE/SkfB family radical SAM enzyme